MAGLPNFRVTMHYNEMQFTYHVMFFVSNVQIGKALHFGDRERIFRMMKAAYCSVEDHQIVENTLRQRRPGRVELRLTDEEFAKLKRGK
jgi:hypothetical protein